MNSMSEGGASRSIVARFGIAAVALACGLGAPKRADAASDLEKAAVKALLSGQDAALADFKAAMTTDATSLRKQIKLLETGLALGADGPAAVEELFVDLEAFQDAVALHLLDAVDAQASAAADALVTLVPSVEGQYPAAFYPGDGTPTAAFESAVDDITTKTYDKLRERLGKTADRCAEAGVNVTFRIESPRRPRRIWSSVSTDWFVAPQATIDLVIAFSTKANAGDGKLRVAGNAGHFQGIADDVTLTANFNGDHPSQTVTPSNGRYVADFANAAVAEGVWLIGVVQNSFIPTDVTIGVR